MNRSTVRLGAALFVAFGLSLAGCSGGSTGPGPGPLEGGGAASNDPSGLRLIEEWTWPAPAPSSAGMPAADGEGIAVTSGRRRITVLDGSGSVRWQADRAGLRDVAPRLTPDLVLVPTEDGLVAYDRATGRLRWETTIKERANTPALVGSRAVVTTWEGSLVAVELADGREAWRARLGGAALGPPAAASGNVVIATWDSGQAAGAIAVEGPSGRTRWAVGLPPGGVSAPAVAGTTVVVVAGDVAAHGLALDGGMRRWRLQLPGAGSPEVPPLALGDATVLVPTRLGSLALVDATDGRSRWDATSDGAAVRGAPAGPGPNGWFALPLDDGRILFAGPDRSPDVREPPSLVSGVATGPGGLLVVGTAQGTANGLSGISGW